MRAFRGRESDRRPGLRELDPELRDRILALDEPVARENWADVVHRSRDRVVWTRRIPAFVAVAASSVALVAGATFGLRFAPMVELGNHVALPHLGAAQSRILYVSPTSQGGFCYQWGSGHARCESKPQALGVSWGRNQVAGAVAPGEASSVKIEFTDGTSAEPDISRVSRKVNAAFFLYDIPAGKIVAQVKEYDAGSLNRQVLWYSV